MTGGKIFKAITGSEIPSDHKEFDRLVLKAHGIGSFQGNSYPPRSCRRGPPKYDFSRAEIDREIDRSLTEDFQ
ncbi:hypothetical protein C0584_05115 [Candidatus Parcubacteria bacterium]|nr:MAG: hypothetical protein C0584_05115 [Candidatus Parcubacteria bacterium]